jgi:hypothetical protein
MNAALPAGWYADPADDQQYRYWAGGHWTTHVQPRRGVDAADGDRPLPDFDGHDRAPSTPGARRGRRRVPVLLAALGLAVVAASAGIAVDGGDSTADSGHTLWGQVRVAAPRAAGADDGPAFRAEGSECGDRHGPGVGTGDRVSVHNGRNQELGTVRLGTGRLEQTLVATTCVFDYRVTGIEDAELYRVRVASRPAARVTRAMVTATDWHLDLRIG